jgi:hypothetical protein
MTEPDSSTADGPEPASARAAESVFRSESGALLAGILDAYLAELRAGKSPDRGELLAAHPALATQLEACLAGIEFVHRAAGPAADGPATLGEFEIVRELGRGSMGVVYEADQTSLRRRVALKVLRFGPVAELEAMQRFRREAETVARLHHTNIVPIFAVGCERDVHYYAMQFIEGQSLADVLAESRRTGKLLSISTGTESRTSSVTTCGCGPMSMKAPEKPWRRSLTRGAMVRRSGGGASTTRARGLR